MNSAGIKVMLDTNALIDLVAPREPYAADIKKLCVAAAFGDLQIWASTQSYLDAYYVLSKNAPVDEIKHALLSTLDVFMVCGTYAADLRNALESDWKDIEDHMLAHSGKHIPAKYLVTRDEELVEKSPVKAMTAKELLKLLEEEHGVTYDEFDIESGERSS